MMLMAMQIQQTMFPTTEDSTSSIITPLPPYYTPYTTNDPKPSLSKFLFSDLPRKLD